MHLNDSHFITKNKTVDETFISSNIDLRYFKINFNHVPYRYRCQIQCHLKNNHFPAIIANLEIKKANIAAGLKQPEDLFLKIRFKTVARFQV